MSTFAELIDELQARGFFTGDDTRAGLYINTARAELDGMRPWPYLEKGVSGNAPLTITDLRTVEAVTNEDLDYQIRPASYQQLIDAYGDLSVTGTPAYFYVAWDAGVPVVTVYPASSSTTIGVQYYRVTVDLTGTDEPAAPSQFHSLYVDIAQRNAYEDRGDYGAAANLQAIIDRKLAFMVDQLLGGQQIAGSADVMAVSDFSTDW